MTTSTDPLAKPVARDCAADAAESVRRALGAQLAYSPANAARVADVSRSLIYDEIAAGRLVARHVGRRRLILAEDLAAWLEGLPT